MNDATATTDRRRPPPLIELLAWIALYAILAVLEAGLHRAKEAVELRAWPR